MVNKNLKLFHKTTAVSALAVEVTLVRNNLRFLILPSFFDDPCYYPWPSRRLASTIFYIFCQKTLTNSKISHIFKPIVIEMTQINCFFLFVVKLNLKKDLVMNNSISCLQKNVRICHQAVYHLSLFWAELIKFRKQFCRINDWQRCLYNISGC